MGHKGSERSRQQPPRTHCVERADPRKAGSVSAGRGHPGSGDMRVAEGRAAALASLLCPTRVVGLWQDQGDSEQPEPLLFIGDTIIVNWGEGASVVGRDKLSM